MDLGAFRTLCLSLKGAREDYPFDAYTVAFKVMGKIFALADTTDFTAVNLKVSPEEGVRMRERFAAVSPGYHMNKMHWVTVALDGSVPGSVLTSWIVQSYTLVVGKLPKRAKLRLESN